MPIFSTFIDYIIGLMLAISIILIVIAIVKLLFIAVPKAYAYFDFDSILKTDESILNKDTLESAINNKYNEKVKVYNIVNRSKAKNLKDGIILGLVGLTLLVLINLISIATI